MLGGKNKIPYKVDSERYKIAQIQTLYELQEKKEIKIWTRSKWKNVKITKHEVEYLVEVKLKNDSTIYYFDDDHIHKILGEERLQKTSHLIIDDLIPYARQPFKNVDLYLYRQIEEVNQSESTDKFAYQIDVNSSMYMLYGGFYIWNPKYYKENF